MINWKMWAVCDLHSTVSMEQTVYILYRAVWAATVVRQYKVDVDVIIVFSAYWNKKNKVLNNGNFKVG